MKKILDTFRQGHHEFENGRIDDFEGVNPFDLFELWTTEAVENKENEPNAFVLATVNESGQSSSRIVYLKDIIENKFVFYTNYNSQKGRDIESNPKVSMLFFWPGTSRQVRIEGHCSKVHSDTSDAYFASRPRGSQIGAWASNQSEELTNREVLEAQFEAFESKFPGEIPRPEHWGGYWIDPSKIEFWQGRPSRLHDRIQFEKNEDTWKNRRLNP
ncbi:pyridoxamine 5'-phosphate oxidase [Crocinitomicaceae bacterium]|nr:pyridoxamine 5'-phosphate oxidase [Crocinitomicaceae bacterium]